MQALRHVADLDHHAHAYNMGTCAAHVNSGIGGRAKCISHRLNRWSPVRRMRYAFPHIWFCDYREEKIADLRVLPNRDHSVAGDVVQFGERPRAERSAKATSE